MEIIKLYNGGGVQEEANNKEERRPPGRIGLPDKTREQSVGVAV